MEEDLNKMPKINDFCCTKLRNASKLCQNN